MVNVGEIANLPFGAVVETMGHIQRARSRLDRPPAGCGSRLVPPHAEFMIRTTEAGLSGDLDEALMALVADPVCAHLPQAISRKWDWNSSKQTRNICQQLFLEDRRKQRKLATISMEVHSLRETGTIAVCS